MTTNTKDIGLVLGQKITAVIRGEAYYISIRGWITGSFILTDVPTIQGQVVKLAPQSGCNIRFVRNGMMVMFETFVEYIYSQSISFMVVEYPQSIDKIKLDIVKRSSLTNDQITACLE